MYTKRVLTVTDTHTSTVVLENTNATGRCRTLARQQYDGLEHDGRYTITLTSTKHFDDEPQ